ncbi:TetR/AcrR family transcriptional regulator [Jhaorihella thermophila]|uniref:DNA-binding transcriptional regulator, AcrR family n=1 Tax=Jhaorihella thermophila TaxID=488547 RepID=A0A1H5UR61_9RHOB|nr:TetR/AcrR family transcriptional regulator [Jhaorihella thermophila]SEF77519.1 DNA-binding transcriptional regulator, AcrR family [Jhaorihella thermophila]
MTAMSAKLKDRAARKLAKRDQKKRQIAQSALAALRELGYANTSLRDIAERSDLSLGMLHYYFEDRSDLIIFCVRTYKENFVLNVTEALDRAEGRDAVIAAFSEALAASIVDDAMTHRLWYDIRTQAMFDDAFRPVVAEIEAGLIGTLRAACRKAGHDAPKQVEIGYAMLDGVFRYLMQSQIGGTPRSREDLRATLRSVIERIL